MNIDLSGTRVLVTGGNTGLGAGTVRGFAAAGASVAIGYYSAEDAAHALVEELRAAPGAAEILLFPLDIRDTARVSEVFASIDEAWGGIDVLVNNAGVDGKPARGWDIEVDAWRNVVETNLFGTFNCSHQALKRMIPERKGVVINISSVHEVIPWTGYSAYCASKAAISMMAKTLAQEAGPHNVRVLSIAPGAMKTEINQAVWSDPDGFADILRKIPLDRMGSPEDVANLAVFLASDKAGYITGTTVFTDGGMTDYPSFMHGG